MIPFLALSTFGVIAVCVGLAGVVASIAELLRLDVDEDALDG